MSAERLIAGLLRVAREDLEGARILSESGNRNAVYLASQSAEKILRATLTAEGKHAGIKHQLDEMIDLLPDENPWKASFHGVEHLSAYATSFRYPSPVGRIKVPPPPEDLQEIFVRIEALLLLALSHFGVALEEGDVPAKSASPPR
jgi:HEPN domain-containing protein